MCPGDRKKIKIAVAQLIVLWASLVRDDLREQLIEEEAFDPGTGAWACLSKDVGPQQQDPVEFLDTKLKVFAQKEKGEIESFKANKKLRKAAKVIQEVARELWEQSTKDVKSKLVACSDNQTIIAVFNAVLEYIDGLPDDPECPTESSSSSPEAPG